MKRIWRALLLSVSSLLLLLFVVAGWVSQAKPHHGNPQEFGNHSLQGAYAFYADGVVEDESSGYLRGIWEIGRFNADGQGNWTGGVEYSSLLSSSDPEVVDQNFTFEGTYEIFPDGSGKGHVTVFINPEFSIEKDLWFMIHSVAGDGIANGFFGGHVDADLGGGVHGNSRTHVGWRMKQTGHFN